MVAIEFPSPLDIIRKKCVEIFGDDKTISVDYMDSVNGEESLQITIINEKGIEYIINVLLIGVYDARVFFDICFITKSEFDSIERDLANGISVKKLLYHQKISIVICEDIFRNSQGKIDLKNDKGSMVLALYGKVGHLPYEIAGIQIMEDDDITMTISIHKRYKSILENAFECLVKKWDDNNS